jgi:hypothetical protein
MKLTLLSYCIIYDTYICKQVLIQYLLILLLFIYISLIGRSQHEITHIKIVEINPYPTTILSYTNEFIRKNIYQQTFMYSYTYAILFFFIREKST